MGKVIEYIGDDINDPMVKRLMELSIGKTIEAAFIPGNLYRLLVMVNDDVEIDLSSSYRPVEFRYEIPINENTFRYVNNIKRIIRFLCGVKRVDYYDNLFIPYRQKHKIYIRGSHDIDIKSFKPFSHTFLGEVGWYNKVLESLKVKVETEKVGNFLIAEGWYDIDFVVMDNIVSGYKEKYSVISKALTRRCRQLGLGIVRKYLKEGVILVREVNVLYVLYS